MTALFAECSSGSFAPGTLVHIYDVGTSTPVNFPVLVDGVDVNPLTADDNGNVDFSVPWGSTFDIVASSPGRTIFGTIALTSGSPTITDAAGSLGPGDIGRSVTGNGIPGSTTIAADADVPPNPGRVISGTVTLDATTALVDTALIDKPNPGRVISGTITLASSTALVDTAGNFSTVDVGKSVEGTDIPGGTTISAYVSTTQVTLSAAATGSLTGGTVELGSLTDVVTGSFSTGDVGRAVTGELVPDGTTITALVSSSEVTMSNAATGTVTGGTVTLGSSTSMTMTNNATATETGGTVVLGDLPGTRSTVVVPAGS